MSSRIHGGIFTGNHGTVLLYCIARILATLVPNSAHTYMITHIVMNEMEYLKGYPGAIIRCVMNIVKQCYIAIRHR